MNFDDVLQLQALKLKALRSGAVNGRLLDAILDADGETIPTRQMCAKVSVQLYARLEEVCNLLDMSKREFIEASVSDAITRAFGVIEKNQALEQGEL